MEVQLRILILTVEADSTSAKLKISVSVEKGAQGTSSKRYSHKASDFGLDVAGPTWRQLKFNSC
jgi:hypothetical protein